MPAIVKFALCISAFAVTIGLAAPYFLLKPVTSPIDLAAIAAITFVLLALPLVRQLTIAASVAYALCILLH